MKRIALAGAAAAALAATAALAQPGPGSRRGPAQPVTRAEIQAKVQSRFARLDTNRDGFVTREEIEVRRNAVRGEFQDQRGQRRAGLFERLDANRDGVLSREEFENRTALRAGRDGAPRERFGRFGAEGPRRGGMGGGFGLRHFDALDANRDGRVSLAEAQSRALQLFDRVDANHDGTVTPDERRAARETFRAQRLQRRG